MTVRRQTKNVGNAKVIKVSSTDPSFVRHVPYVFSYFSKVFGIEEIINGKHTCNSQYHFVMMIPNTTWGFIIWQYLNGKVIAITLSTEIIKKCVVYSRHWEKQEFKHITANKISHTSEIANHHSTSKE